MSSVSIEVSPEEVGFSGERLDRLGMHMRKYVDSGRFAGTACLVSRRGRIAYLDHYGKRDKEADLAVEADTIYRIYSMTKPLTSIAMMQLYEQGLINLSDPIERYLPEFVDMKVLEGGSLTRPMLRPAALPITIHHLLTHTSGLTYGFMNASVVDAMYRAAGIDMDIRNTPTSDVVAGLAKLPLLCDPGTSWNYSMSTDVLGHLVEVISGKSLSQYFDENILGPLDMGDTGFSVADDAHDRFGACYTRHPATGQTALLDGSTGSPYLKEPAYLSGGGGLVSTMRDYHRFCLALMNGGELDGQRIIGPRTLGYMTTNHLPGGGDLVECGTPLFSEAPYAGVGFGLGFSVQMNPAASLSIASVGEFAWGGMASTAFFCDPVEDLHVIFMTQLIPSTTYPIRAELKALVYQALID